MWAFHPATQPTNRQGCPRQKENIKRTPHSNSAIAAHATNKNLTHTALPSEAACPELIHDSIMRQLTNKISPQSTVSPATQVGKVKIVVGIWKSNWNFLQPPPLLHRPVPNARSQVDGYGMRYIEHTHPAPFPPKTQQSVPASGQYLPARPKCELWRHEKPPHHDSHVLGVVIRQTYNT